MEIPGIEPGTSHMRSVRSTTELHPQSSTQCVPKVYRSNYAKIKINKLEMPGIEPGASHMQSVRSTTELHPLCVFNYKTGFIFYESTELNLKIIFSGDAGD